MRKRMVGAISLALLAMGCGSSDDYANDPRPPAPVNVGINVTDGRVLVSPSRIGAGPVVLIVSNQSRRSHDITLTPPAGSSSACLEADTSSGPITPNGTARMPVELIEGDCVVSVRGKRGISPALLSVGAERASAQNDLLQP